MIVKAGIVTLNEKVLFSHPGCPPFAQQAARALYEVDMLSTYATTFSYQADSVLGKALRTGLSLAMDEPERQLLRRQITEVPEEIVVHHALSELLRTFAARTPMGPVFADRVWEKTELWFDRTVAKHDLNGEGVVYGYEHACLSTFQKQKARGGLCIYDLPIAHHKLSAELLEPEMERFPETHTTYDAHLRREAPRRNARKDEELALADHVVVASSFTKSSLLHIGFPEEKISVIPYGAPEVTAHNTRDENAPFVFLSAGTQSVRKGVHYTLDAWRKIAPPESSAELWLIGHMQLPDRLLKNLPGKVVIRSSVPKVELDKIYERANVLVFPSLVEGFGMVITEAMAHGLPVITTPNTAGPELIDHGRNGFIIPVRDTDALTERLHWCLNNKDGLTEMGRQAALAAERWQWGNYRGQLAHTIRALVAESAQSAELQEIRAT